MADELDREEERRARRAEREADLAERRLKFRLAVGIIGCAFALLLVASVASLFGRRLDLPPWQYWVPFVAAALIAVFNFDFRDYLGGGDGRRDEREGS